MAAQQVLISIFYCLTPVADALGLTAQSFVPGIAEAKKSKERTDALKKTSSNFVKVGALFGILLTAFVGIIPLISRFFTTDATVLAAINQVVPYFAAAFSVHGIICSVEGVLVGQKDLAFLGRAYGSFFFAVPYFMLQVKKRALAGAIVELSSVWSVFLGYQAVRVTAWLIRLAMLNRRADREVGEIKTENIQVMDITGMVPLTEVEGLTKKSIKNDSDELLIAA